MCYALRQTAAYLVLPLSVVKSLTVFLVSWFSWFSQYNYTEVANAAIFYGICYWLDIPHDKAVQMASQVLTTNLKLEGMKDEERDKMFDQILSKLQPLKKPGRKGSQ